MKVSARGMMAEAAVEGDAQAWQISFKATLTTITEMLPVSPVRTRRFREKEQISVLVHPGGCKKDMCRSHRLY
jgi:hypothetical protein